MVDFRQNWSHIQELHESWIGSLDGARQPRLILPQRSSTAARCSGLLSLKSRFSVMSGQSPRLPSRIRLLHDWPDFVKEVVLHDRFFPCCGRAMRQHRPTAALSLGPCATQGPVRSQVEYLQRARGRCGRSTIQNRDSNYAHPSRCENLARPAERRENSMQEGRAREHANACRAKALIVTP